MSQGKYLKLEVLNQETKLTSILLFPSSSNLTCVKQAQEVHSIQMIEVQLVVVTFHGTKGDKTQSHNLFSFFISLFRFPELTENPGQNQTKAIERLHPFRTSPNSQVFFLQMITGNECLVYSSCSPVPFNRDL